VSCNSVAGGRQRRGEESSALEAARDRLAAALAEHARLTAVFGDARGRPHEAAARARLAAARARVEALDRWLSLLERPRRP